MDRIKKLIKNVVADRESSGYEYVDGFEDAKDRVIEIIDAEELSKGHERIGFVDEEMSAALASGNNSTEGHTEKRPYAQPNAQRRSIYTDAATWEALLELGRKATGKRSASAGIREAVRISEGRG